MEYLLLINEIFSQICGLFPKQLLFIQLSCSQMLSWQGALNLLVSFIRPNDEEHFCFAFQFLILITNLLKFQIKNLNYNKKNSFFRLPCSFQKTITQKLSQITSNPYHENRDKLMFNNSISCLFSSQIFQSSLSSSQCRRYKQSFNFS